MSAKLASTLSPSLSLFLFQCTIGMTRVSCAHKHKHAEWPFVQFNVISLNAGILINEFEFVAGFTFRCAYTFFLVQSNICIVEVIVI